MKTWSEQLVSRCIQSDQVNVMQEAGVMKTCIHIEQLKYSLDLFFIDTVIKIEKKHERIV